VKIPNRAVRSAVLTTWKKVCAVKMLQMLEKQA
jgi:hypothetical protein